MPLPQLFVIGAPKAGTTALHSALATHPALWMSEVKEPKYYLCGDRPPPRQYGPGDAHSRREWIWHRREYERLFAHAPPGAITGESTPFYLSDEAAHRRIAQDVPDARLIAVLRDPVDRAYSNWTHLRTDGLEPEADFVRACRLEPRRVAAGWAPFWRYIGLGCYGRQLQSLQRWFPIDQIHLLRYRDLVDRPDSTLADIGAFLGVDGSLFTHAPAENVSGFAPDTRFNQALRLLVRRGAAVGKYLPPHVWRRAERPLRRQLRRTGAHRPELPAEQRAEVQRYFTDDIVLLADLSGRDFSDWLAGSGRGAYSVRRS